jgi:fucose permease
LFNKSSTILWISSIFFGLSIVAIYPSTISYTEKYITLTGKRMSVLAVGGYTGGAVIPLLIGFSMNSTLIGIIGFILVALAVVILASILFGIIVFCTGQRS